MWYTVKDVMTLLSIGKTTAYNVIRELREEIAHTKMPNSDFYYSTPPAGKIQKDYFCKKFMFDVSECDKLLTKGAN